MNAYLMTMVYWHWIGLGVILLIVEVLTGTGTVLWTGLSALALGLLVYVVPAMPIGAQWLIFAFFSLLSALCWKLYLRRRPIKTDQPTLNRRADQYIGRIFTLQSPIVNRMGKIHVDDTMWCVRCCDDLPEGVLVRVTGSDGVILIVKKED